MASADPGHRWTVMSVLPLVLLAACTPAGGGDGPSTPSPTPSTDTATTTTVTTPTTSTPGWEDPPLSTANPAGTDAVILNPERGFYQYIDLVTTDDLSGIRGEGSTLVFSYIRLDDFRDQDLPQSLARDAGVKVIPRFAYNFGPWPNSEPDASKDWVLTHIDQVTPLLQANADVIAFVQAGFIGAWGEWHSSTEGLLDDPADKFEILEALLDALPPERAVQLRYPPYKDEGYGGPLDAITGHDGSYASRIGHHNDCFLASDTDYGTYPPGERADWLAWLNQENLYVPMGGETCNLYPALTDCTPALVEFEDLRFSYINHDYHPDVVDGWTAGGCYEEIDRRLGYRLVLTEVEWPEQVRPGGQIPLTVTVRNDGWAPPVNPRPVQVVLAAGTTHVATLDADPRGWHPGETVVLQVRLQLPADLSEGDWELGLALPDADPVHALDARYAIQFANDGTWRDGWNALATVSVTDNAPGSADPGATAFEPLQPTR